MLVSAGIMQWHGPESLEADQQEAPLSASLGAGCEVLGTRPGIICFSAKVPKGPSPSSEDPGYNFYKTSLALASGRQYRFFLSKKKNKQTLRLPIFILLKRALGWSGPVFLISFQFSCRRLFSLLKNRAVILFECSRQGEEHREALSQCRRRIWEREAGTRKCPGNPSRACFVISWAGRRNESEAQFPCMMG